MSDSKREKKDLPPLQPLSWRRATSGQYEDVQFDKQLQNILYQFITANKIALPEATFFKIYDANFITAHNIVDLKTGTAIPRALINFIADLAKETGGENAIRIAMRLDQFLTTVPSMHPANIDALRTCITFYNWAKHKGLSDNDSMAFAVSTFDIISKMNHESRTNIFFTAGFDRDALQTHLNGINSSLQMDDRFTAIAPAFLEFFERNMLHPKQQLLLQVYEWGKQRGFPSAEFANAVLSAIDNYLSLDPATGKVTLAKGCDFASLQKKVMEVAENKEQVDPQGKRYRMFALHPFPNPKGIAEDFTAYLEESIAPKSKHEKKT
ncbi:MAG: hypothetical protein ACYCQI_09795 [Gammaproteobacteria bacterium]